MDDRLRHITHVFLDADDTLWENEIYFRRTEEEFSAYMSRYADKKLIAKTLAEKQEENIPVFGYGSKTYMIGMLDTARTLCPERFGPAMYEDIKEMITRLTTHPFRFIDGAEDTVMALSGRYKLVIATKGEMSEQLRKYHLSGLDRVVTAIEVMERKSPEDYLNMCIKMNIAPENMLMVGNAVRSDIAPVIKIGGWGIYVPHSTTWIHEIMPLPDSPRVLQIQGIRQVMDILL